MRTGDIFEVADVLKHLTYLSNLKPLSFREQRMLERSRYLVVSELAAVAASLSAISNPCRSGTLPGTRKTRSTSSPGSRSRSISRSLKTKLAARQGFFPRRKPTIFSQAQGPYRSACGGRSCYDFRLTRVSRQFEYRRS